MSTPKKRCCLFVRSSGSSKAAKAGQPPSSISSITAKTKNRNIKKAKSPSVKEQVPTQPAASSSQVCVY